MTLAHKWQREGERGRERVKLNIFNYHSKMVGEKVSMLVYIVMKNEAAIT